MFNPPFRVILTILLLQGTSLFVPTSHRFGVYVFLPFLTDLFDCDSWVSKKKCASVEYHQNDKLLDVLTYAWILHLVRHYLSPLPYAIAWFVWLWRAIGVWRFWQTGDRNVFIPHPDLVNGLLVTEFFLHSLSINPSLTSPLRVVLYTSVLVLKVRYEQYRHRTS